MRLSILGIAFYLTLITTVHAEWHPHIGAGFGLAKSQNSLKERYSSVIGSSNQLVNIGALGTTQSVCLGLTKQLPSFFFGSEIFTNFHQLKKTKKGPELLDNMGPLILLNFKLKKKYSNGVSFFIGKDLFPCLDIMFKLDLFLSRFKLQYYHPEENKAGAQSKQLFGYAPGFALQSRLSEHFRVRLDYAYRIYDTFKSKNISNETLVANTLIKGKVVPRVHQFLLNFIYAF